MRILPLAAALLLAPALPAQDLPEGFQNLQVLPQEISKDELKATMDGFTEQLGVKCTFCHILDEYEKDELEHKLIARKMLRLVRFMRANAEEYFKEGTGEEKISCGTCHRGKAEVEAFEADDDDWI